MNKRLGDDDALAVDLVLDRTNMVSGNTSGSGDGNGHGNGGDTGVFFAPVGDAVAVRIGAVEAVLRVLNELPDENPPAGLAERTVGKILQHPLAAGPHAPPPTDERRPPA
ncbi:MAG TPA: hypothetical protein VH518_15885 [Tepidisphaeraceae bacterium]